MKLQFRMEAIDALSYTVLWNPDTNPRNATVGFINQDRNNPRDLQIGARFTFEERRGGESGDRDVSARSAPSAPGESPSDYNWSDQ